MTPLLILIGLIAIPVVLMFFLKINAAFVFLSLCLGDVLIQFVGTDAESAVSGASRNAQITSNTVLLALLLLPAILTMVFMLKTVKGNKRFVNVIPSLGTGLLLALLVVPLLPGSLSTQVSAQSLWVQSQSLRSAIVGGSAAVCLISLWLGRPKHHAEKEGKKHKG